MNRIRLSVAPALVLALCIVTPTRAWHAGGHKIVSHAAVQALPSDVPAFFREGTAAIAHSSVDPDAFKNRAAPQLTDQEEPEHYLDLELLEGSPLPPRRSAYLRLLQEKNLPPRTVGLLPYSVSEAAQRLTVAFAEHRAFPEDPHIRAKCLVYAGLLSHYAADLTQPLHCTIHWDGRAGTDGRSPRSGIHEKVDGLIERLNLDPAQLARGQDPQPLDEVFAAAVAQLQESFTHVERVYELEALLPAADQTDPQVVAFTTERARAATAFLARLYLTAWRDSEHMKLPDWLLRARP